MGAIDKNRVKRSFGRQAHEYDRHTDVQKRVVTRFLEILRAQDVEPGRILDVGTGTGMLLSRLSRVYPGLPFFGIDLAPEMSRAARQKMPDEINAHLLSADAERLPFADGTFTLVLSTSTFQWLNTLDPAFAEAFRVMASGGLFFFALFGESTLCELKNSYRKALVSSGRLREDHTHSFRTVQDVEEALLRAGFGNCCATSERYLEYHENVPALLRSLKNIGAGNAAQVPSRGLASRRIMQRMFEAYRSSYCCEGLVPVTYEVIYAMGRKSLSGI